MSFANANIQRERGFFNPYRIARAGAHHSKLNPSGGKAPVAFRRQGSEFQEIPPTPAPSFGPSLRPRVPFSNLPYSPAGGVASCGTTKPSCHSRNCKDLRFSGRGPKNKKWIGLGGNQDPKPCLVRQKNRRWHRGGVAPRCGQMGPV